MSESVAETTGDTGEVDVDQGSTDVVEGEQTEGGDLSAEDQAAEEALALIMRDEEVQHWKDVAQKHERAARDNKGAADKLRRLEDANKSEIQKAQERAEAAETRATALETLQNQTSAAAAHKLDSQLITYLGGGTAEEITERAATLAGIIKASATAMAEQMVKEMNGAATQGGSIGTRRPVETLRPGAAPTSTEPTTPDAMFRDLLNRRDEM